MSTRRDLQASGSVQAVPALGQRADTVEQDVILNVREAADMADLSVRTFYRLMAEGIAPPRVGLSTRRFGFWRSDIQSWLRSRTAPRKAA